MEAPQIVQTRSAPLEENAETARVGWVADHAPDEDVLGRKAGYVVAVEDRIPIKTEWSGFEDFDNCPKSYEDWALQYRDYTRAMLIRFGAQMHEVEDLMHTIMARFMERDSLGVFTPDWGSKSKSGKSKFQSYYTRFLFTYYKSQKRNNVKHYTRHLAILDAPVSSEGDVTWGDMHADVRPEGAFDRVEFTEVIDQLREKVDPELLETVLAMAEDGPVRQKALGEKLGTDTRTASAGLRQLRSVLSELLGENV